MSDHYYCRICQKYYDDCTCDSKRIQEKIKYYSKIQEEINKGEKLKRLLHKYADLEYQDDKSLIYKSSGNKCKCYKFIEALGDTYLRIYFIEEGYEIYVTPSFAINEFETNKEFIEHLDNLNIPHSLILEIIKDKPEL